MSQLSERFGTTWWGRLWITALEQLGDDFENRLPRGKKYAEEGAVSHFTVSPGEIQAKVHGRKTYNVTLGLPALTAAQWEKALERIQQESRFVASLLAGEMPQGLDETFREAGASLYPRVPKELQTHCDCPDWANPCKHVAAVCYIMAEALDRDPWLLFDLRGRTREEVLEALQAMMEVPPPEPAPRKRGRPRKVVSVVDLLPRRRELAEPWFRLPGRGLRRPAPCPCRTSPCPAPSPPTLRCSSSWAPCPTPASRRACAWRPSCTAPPRWCSCRSRKAWRTWRTRNPRNPPRRSPFETPMPAPSISKPWRHNKKRRWGKN